MCRSIRSLFNFDPPVTEAEILAAAPLLSKLETQALPKNRDAEAAKAKLRRRTNQGAN